MGAAEIQFTEEQQAAIEYARSGRDLRLFALAGSGKTTVCRGMIEQTDGRKLFLAFNRKNADEGRARFGDRADCATGHALAFGHVVRGSPGYTRKFKANNGRVTFDDVNDLVGLSDVAANKGDAYTLFQVVIDTLTRYMQSSDRVIGAQHLPTDAVARLRTLSGVCASGEDLIERVLLWAVQVWNAMRNETSEFPLSHDGYFKIFALMEADLGYDRLLLDESQDTNDVLAHWFAQQSGQKIAVGDPHQQIYRWRGANNAMAALPGEKLHLTGVFRFGPEVAAAGNRVLRLLGQDESNLMTGLGPSEQPWRPGREFAVLARTNAGMLADALALLNKGHKAVEVARLDALERLVLSAYALWRHRKWEVTAPELRMFGDWHSLLTFADATGSQELKMLVNIVTEYGDKLPAHMERLRSASQPGAPAKVSTLHVAKGLEFEHAFLRSSNIDDLMVVDAKSGQVRWDRDELNLLYVGLTRGKRSVHVDETLLAQIDKAAARGAAFVPTQ